MQPFFRRFNFSSPRLTGEAADVSPRAADGPHSTKTAMWSYLISNEYADTVVHGLFHFVVIMLAFVVGNVWANREATLQVIRGQYAVMILLDDELNRLQTHALRLSRDKRLQPCKDGFSSQNWSTKQWDSMRREDLAYLLANWDFYKGLVGVYNDVKTRASQGVSAASVERCTELWAGASKRLNEFRQTMTTHRNELGEQLKNYEGWRGVVSPTNMRIYGWILVGLVAVITLPVALRAFENTLRRTLSDFVTGEISAPAGRDTDRLRVPLVMTAIYFLLLGLCTLSPAVVRAVFGYVTGNPGVLSILSASFLGSGIVLWNIAGAPQRHRNLPRAVVAYLALFMALLLSGWAGGLYTTQAFAVPLVAGALLAGWICGESEGPSASRTQPADRSPARGTPDHAPAVNAGQGASAQIPTAGAATTTDSC